MAVQNQFIQVSNHSTDQASSWIYLVDWILVLILGIAFVFYFGRLIGFVLSLIFKLIVWRRYKIMVNVESVRLSFLGGRLLIKNLSIASENQTVTVLRVNFTWRYWLWGRSRLPEYQYEQVGAEPPTVDKHENEKLPTKFFLVLEGLEVFMYNRTYAYDNIMDILTKQKDSDDDNVPEREADGLRYRGFKNSLSHSNTSTSSNKKSDELTMESDEVDMKKLHDRLQLLIRIFPISVAIRKAVMVLGNKKTPSFIVSSCKTASGIIDIRPADSPLDIYKQLFYFQMDNFQVSLKPNILYDETMKSNNLQEDPSKVESISKFKSLQHSLNKIPSLFPSFRKNKRSMNINYQNWVGLRRYINDSLDDFNHIYDNLLTNDEEYGKASLILDTLTTKLSYHYDIPGKVDLKDIDSSPQFGVDVELSMATIQYGPWADRQRVPIQQVFFPSVCRDSELSPKPVPGQLRQYSGFKWNAFTNDEIILRVPSREPSKDKEILKSTRNPSTNKISRPYGWVELKMGPNSTISSFNSFLCQKEEGYPNTLSAMFVEPELRSSVNHDILYTADLHTLDARIGFPLEWNGPCEWLFDNFSANSKIFFLREHELLLSDIITDFGSGPPAPYEQFRPFTYKFAWTLLNYKFYLNINDSNIINNPLDFNTNKYVSFQGEEIKIQVKIPLLTQVTRLTCVDFDIFAPCFELILDIPPWHTMNSFLEASVLIGRAKNFTIEGSYSYLSTVEINTSNTIMLKSKADDVMIKFYGLVVKYLFTIRENYLGNKFHFKTFDEYNEEHLRTQATSEHSSSGSETLGDQFDYWKLVKTENNIDVLLSFQVRNGLLVLPGEIYGCRKHLALSFDYFDTDIRFTNFYMDMQADFSPIYGKFVVLDSKEEETSKLGDIRSYIEEYSLRILPHITLDELSVHGHRMFGIPPEEITYFCNWRIGTNSVDIDAEPSFILSLGQSVSSFLAGFHDLENALHPVPPTVYDALCFAFDCLELNIRLSCHNRSVIVSLKPILFTFNDLANERYSSKISLDINEIIHKVVNEEDQTLLALFKTSLTFDNITKKEKCDEHRRLQQEHIRFNDAPYHRAPHLLFDETKDQNYNEAYCSIINPVSLPQIPMPLNKYTNDIYDTPQSLSILSSSSSEKSIPASIKMEDGRLFMPPTIHYNEPDFTPLSQRNPKIKYDNMILNFSDILGFLSPEAVKVYAKFDDQLLEDGLNDLMDSFEKNVVKQLKLIMLQVSMNDVFRIVTPSIDISFGRFRGRDEDEIIKSLTQTPAVNILVTEPSVAISDLVERTKGDSFEDFTIISLKAFACSVKGVLVNVASPAEFSDSIGFSLKDLELWLTEANGESVASHTVEEISMNMNKDQLLWLIGYQESITKELQHSFGKFKRNSEIKGRMEAGLVYSLGQAGKTFKIENDPTVLTKPAYVIRSLSEHIRTFDTWKVLVRFRHIFHSMDESWLREQRDALDQIDWKIPKSGYNDTWNLLSGWRNWDSNLAEREIFFQKIFNIHPVIKKTKINQFLFNNVQIELNNKDFSESDYISLENLHVSFTEKISSVLFLGLPGEQRNGEFDADVKAIHGLVNLGAYDGRVTSITLESLPSILEKVSLLNSGKADSNDNLSIDRSSQNVSYVVMVNVNQFSQHIDLDYTHFSLHLLNLNFTANHEEIEDSYVTTLTLRLPSLELAVEAGGREVFTHKIRGANIIFGDAHSAESTYFVDISVEQGSTQLHDDKISQTVEKIVSHDKRFVDIFSDIATDTKSELDQNFGKKAGSQDLFDVSKSLYGLQGTLNIQLNHYTYSVDVLNAVKIECSLYDNSFSAIASEGLIDISSLIQKIDFSLRSSKSGSSHLEFENSQIFNSVKVCAYEGNPAISVDSQIGYTKISSPRFIKSLNELIDKYPEIEQEYFQVMKVIDEQSTNHGSENLKTEGQHDVFEENKKNRVLDFAKIPLDVKVSNDYIGFTVVADRTRYAMEFEDFQFKFGNVQVDDSKLSFVPHFGSLLIPSMRISIADRTIPLGLSNMVDVNILVKVLNDKKEVKGQILEIVSQYCRVCLSPGIIKRIVFLADELTIIGKRIDKLLVKKPEPKPDVGQSESVFSKFSGLHFLSYNFCVGWIFEQARNDYPGLICGAERIYAVTGENMGKLSLMEAYLAVAHGSNSSGFYSTESEITNSNRAFLPFMQFIYIITEENDDKNMKITVTGDELDVNYLSNAFHIFEYSIKSASSVQDFFDSRVRPMDKWKDEDKTHEEQQVDYINSLRSTFSSIDVKATFAGSNVAIQKVSETEDAKAILLHFPAVKSVITYAHDKLGEKKHTIKSEIFTSSSDNKLYAACVPVLMDIIYGVKQMMKLQNQEKQTGEVGPKQEQEPVKHLNISALLEDTDFHFGLRVDRQRLSLSCEPTAKVEAVVGIEGIYFQLNSGNRASINILAILDSISASLQHVYSREVSGSVKVNAVTLTTNVNFDDEISVKSANSISDVEGYVNVKQYQDLALFKDIWYPEETDTDMELSTSTKSVQSTASKLANNNNIALRFKEVSTTNAVPWFITFLLNNVSLRVDCGPALGDMRFNLDQLWAVSQKTLDWSQQFRLGLNQLEITSEGRLGGRFVCSDTYIHSEITWKLPDGNVLDVPLILVSAGIDRLSLKSTFDYHVFMVVDIQEFSIDVFNQKSELMINKDHLFVTAQFKSCEVYMTSFTASNILDIYNAVLRMTQDNQISYKETLHDSNKDSTKDTIVDKINNNDILETVKKLETEFEVLAGILLVHIYPSSFDDSKVLVVKLDDSSAHFLQNEYNHGIANKLRIEFNDLKVSLSTNTPVLEEFIHSASVDEFTKYAHKARGGNIFLFPSFVISMETFQKYHSNLIEYLYNSTFGGTVDIRWNLGSVNFIREMYSIHSKSLASRTEFKKSLNEPFDPRTKFNQDIFNTKESKPAPLALSMDPKETDVATKDIDEALNDKIDKVSKQSKYNYIPLAPPIIQAPQLKELGNATPPLEWFGLHRNKFPNVTHELGIVGLQKVIHQVENEYSRLLGRA